MTAATTPLLDLRLPDGLREHAEALARAVVSPILGEWPEDTIFADAPGPEAIGRILVPQLHPDLDRFAIGYLFREKIQSKGKTVLAQASKVGGKLAHFSGLDFLIEVNWEAWRRLGYEARIALIDHELCHCGVDWDSDDGPKAVSVPHDLEEFNCIVRRWGIWRNDVQGFADAIDASRAQLTLFK